MSRNLRDFIPKEVIVGPYVYEVEIKNLDKEEVHGLCVFEDRKIILSSVLNFDLDKPNAIYALEVFMHEVLHSFNYNSGLRSMPWKKMKSAEIEEEFVDHTARHIIQFIKDNPAIIKLFALFS